MQYNNAIKINKNFYYYQGKIKSMIKPLVKLSNFCIKKLSGQVKNTKTTANKKLFCEEFWENAAKSGKISASNNTQVSNHGYLNSINHHFHISPYPDQMDEVSHFTKMTPREMITETDCEFKELRPLEFDLHVFRCVGEKPDFFSTYKLYQKALDVKKGETIRMNEYAYATSDIDYAKNYIPNGRGILYEIDVPKGSKVSRIGDIGKCDEIVFPRCSKFKCLDVQDVTDFENSLKVIKLKYLQ